MDFYRKFQGGLLALLKNDVARMQLRKEGRQRQKLMDNIAYNKETLAVRHGVFEMAKAKGLSRQMRRRWARKGWLNA